MVGPVSLDPVALLGQASLPVRATAGILLAASVAVWAVGTFKLRQLGRLAAEQARFERHARRADTRDDLDAITAEIPDAPGARVVAAMTSLRDARKERLRAVADRAIVDERAHATSLVGILGSCASAAPFVGLFGTVYGIMDAFVRIGAEKSASLPVVAPAIGEALLTTAIGLAAAIPAVIFFNAIDRRVAQLVEALEASSADWVEVAATPGLDPSTRRGMRPFDPRDPRDPRVQSMAGVPRTSAPREAT